MAESQETTEELRVVFEDATKCFGTGYDPKDSTCVGGGEGKNKNPCRVAETCKAWRDAGGCPEEAKSEDAPEAPSEAAEEPSSSDGEFGQDEALTLCMDLLRPFSTQVDTKKASNRVTISCTTGDLFILQKRGIKLLVEPDAEHIKACALRLGLSGEEWESKFRCLYLRYSLGAERLGEIIQKHLSDAFGTKSGPSRDQVTPQVEDVTPEATVDEDTGLETDMPFEPEPVAESEPIEEPVAE